MLALVAGELRIARKHKGCAEAAQQEIFAWCAEGLAEGRHVVRLKIGDPYIFGRGAEEVLYFRERGVAARVVPGISSAFAAPLLGGISLLSLRLLAGACRSSLSSLPVLQLQPSSTMSELEPALDASAASPKARRSSAELQLGHSVVGHHAKPAATFA